MEEVFQDYSHYLSWIFSNWKRDEVLDSVIIKNRLLVYRKNNCSGESYRVLKKEEFLEMENERFVKIPNIYESEDYQDGHRLADGYLEDFT